MVFSTRRVRFVLLRRSKTHEAVISDPITVYVNGRFLGRPVTGVERFASNLLDSVQRREGWGLKWRMLLPPDVALPDGWPLFEARRVGTRSGHLWEQTDLAVAARDGLLLNLCNSGPIALRRQLTVIHDAAVYDRPSGFALRYRLLHNVLGRLIARRAPLATVSNWSRHRLAAIFGLSEAAIGLIPNAADHVDAIVPDCSVLASNGIAPGRFLLFVGSFAPNKNLPRALEAWARVRRPDEQLVLVGAAVRSFADHGIEDSVPGVVLPGRISDGQLVALYRNARALIFPSLYEGFGIPPLEAMRFGLPVIAADIPPVREVCGDAALFHDPTDVGALATLMRRVLDDDGLHARLATAALGRRDAYSWDTSADALMALIEGQLGDGRNG